MDYHGKEQIISTRIESYECVILAYGLNLKLTTVKGTHTQSLYAKNEANKNIRFFIIKIKEKYTFLWFCHLLYVIAKTYTSS